MNDLRGCIERLVRRWRPILGLETWAIEVRFDERKFVGSCVAYPDYEEAVVSFNLPAVRREARTAAVLEDLVVHELSHCLTWGVRRAPERITTHVARAILRAKHG